MSKIVIICFVAFNFLIYGKLSEEDNMIINFSLSKLEKLKDKKCNFSKKKLEFKTYEFDDFIIEGYWKNENIPYGLWIQKTHTNKILMEQCYLEKEKIYKQYYTEKITGVAYMDEKFRIEGSYNKNGEISLIFFEEYLGDILKNFERFVLKNSNWEKVSETVIIEGGENVNLYLVDKEKLRKKKN